MKWTEKGAQNAKMSPKRARDFRKLGTKMGFRVKDVCRTSGRYDLVTVCEAPDDETMSAGALAVGMIGNVRTEMMRAYTAGEMEAILKKIT